MALEKEQVEKFVKDGYAKIESAVPADICEQIRDILWRDTGVDRNDRSTWTKPVIRLMFYNDEPFNRAVNMPVLADAYDQLVGKGKWVPRDSIGTFPIRFPSENDPGDTGWHIDSSFPGDDPNDFTKWKINVYSKGRGLLMLFLFSDIGENDAPTKIRIGSHIDVARILEPFGEEGLTFMELASKIGPTENREEVMATGKAGTVYLCHPFIVHAAQPHGGTEPRFLAQPALELREPYSLRGDAPVERAIRLGLSR
ncbi:MAG: phytanoyl-CoA dioxygenase [Sphingobacteriales bacterium]|nr:MAG: phytanoyl-CoA dioxygenase [Sphingobacteriales bacterium]